MSLSLTYGSPEASCIKRADKDFGRRSASLIKEFWALCIFLLGGQIKLVNFVPESIVPNIVEGFLDI